MSNDTKLEAKLHFFNISSFMRLYLGESGFSFEFWRWPYTTTSLMLYYSFLDSSNPRSAALSRFAGGAAPASSREKLISFTALTHLPPPRRCRR